MLLAPAAGSAQLVGFAGSGVALGGNPGALLVLRYPCFIFFFSFCLTAFHAGASCLRKQGCPAERLSSPARFQRSLLLFCGGPSPRLAAGERARRQSWSGRNVPGAAGTAPGCGAARGGPVPRFGSFGFPAAVGWWEGKDGRCAVMGTFPPRCPRQLSSLGCAGWKQSGISQ